MAQFDLDPHLIAMDDFSLVSIKATIIMRKPGFTVCQTVLNKQMFTTSLNLDYISGEFSILDGTLRRIRGHLWIEECATTEVICRPPANVSEPLSAIELCAGLGAGSTAYDMCGVKVQCFNDVNPKYCKWLEQKVSGNQSVVCGDLTSPQTLKQISDAAPASQFLSAGVSCQPFSSLGDQKQQFDDRSRSLPGTLTAAFHLNASWVVLECTKEARFSAWAQSLIDQFCRMTGYRVEQQILDLHRTWPAHRTRWFAVLTHPLLPAVPIPSMPVLPWIPSLLHLTPGVLPTSHEYMDDLRLDFHELKAFNETRRGIHGSIINMCKPMATATHSWGSQLRACECGCRQGGFTDSRLRDKGLYGQLVPLGEEFHEGRFCFHAMRHLHPHEVALYNGLDPKYVTVSGIGSARLELSGVGQMCSPLQLAWIIANVLFETNNQDHISVNCNPMGVMQLMFSRLFASRDEIWQVTNKTVYMEIFEKAVFDLVQHDPTDEDFSLTQQMFDQAVRFESQLVRSARTTQITQNIMPAQNPLPQVRRDEQVLPPLSSSFRGCSAVSLKPSFSADPWQDAIDSHIDSEARPIEETRLPMSGAPFHAEPAGAPATSGPSHKELVTGDEGDGSSHDEVSTHLPMIASTFHAEPVGAPVTSGPAQPDDEMNDDGEHTHPPMSMPNVHADPASAPCTARPSLSDELIVAAVIPADPHPPMSVPDFHANPATVIRTVAGPSQPHAAFPAGQSSCQVESPAVDVDQPVSDALIISGETPASPHGRSIESEAKEDLPTQLYSLTGGLTFTLKRSSSCAALEDAPGSSAKALRTTELDPIELDPTAPWSQPIEVERYVEKDFPTNGFLQGTVIIQVGIDFGPLTPRKVHLLTVKHLLEAENKLHNNHFTCTDILGREMPDDGILIHNHIFLLLSQDADIRCLESVPMTSQDRLTQLWYQQGMIASDEMKFYLQQIKPEFPGISTTPVIFVCPASVDDQLRELIDQAIEICAAMSRPHAVSFACLLDGHWFPLHLWVDQEKAHVYTTPEGHEQLFDLATSFTHDGFEWHCIQIKSEHDMDCGFQCLQWLKSMVYHSATVESMWGREMITLKHEFAAAIHDGLIPLGGVNHLGGASEAAVRHGLVTILEQHGVATDRSIQCATSLIDKLGLQCIANIIGSKQAWRDLKARASQLTPPFQIVLPSELQSSIDARIANKKTFGNKANKQSKPPTASKTIRIRPDQIAVPEGIFHAEKHPVSQISVSGIGNNRTGVAVVSIEEAVPFFALQAPISAGGLALIVLDHQDSRVPQCAEIVKFPAQCKLTDEPVLLTGALLQLGHQKVQRTLPERPISIEEIPTGVLRILVYRDQVTDDWDKFHAGPVRALREHTVFADVETQQIIDVWDRQFLDQQFKKSRSTQAFLFAVNLRLPQDVASRLMDLSATEGVYVEPRSDNGRSPCDKFAIVWMPKKSLSEVVLASQTASIKCWVVRNGLRYGLRVATADAAELHKIHRPDIDFIAGGDKNTFRLGPFPWGTTKQSLQKLFKEWNWQARVGQPSGQDSDNKGLFWSAVSTESPSHWVFTLAHGDVLISRVPQKEAPVRPSHGVVASTRTLKQLTGGDDISADVKSDPWLHQDPWAQAAKPARPTPIAKDQIEALTQQVTDKVLAAVGAPEDVSMHPDHETRVAKLEEQVKSLTTNFSQFHGSVTTFQAQQQQHNTQVGSQITAIKTQVESQASSLQGIIESKLDDQMSRLEALLSKRLKTNEWQATPWHYAKLAVSLTDAQIRCLRLYSMIYRIGEAANPGPVQAEVATGLTIGAMNPTGLLTKSFLLPELPGSVPAIWGVAETQLSAPGIHKFKQELHFRKSPYKLFHGAPAPLRSNSSKAIGGKHVGSAFLTTVPSRPLQSTWPVDTWDQARFVANTFYVQDEWVHGATFYGPAFQADLPAVKAAANDLLSHLTYRVVISLKGKRFICGDFNQVEGQLPETAIWSQHGWKEAQQLAYELYGTPIQCTCKHKTTKDFLWLSPELCQYFERCIVDDSVFKDHAVLCAKFRPFNKPDSVPVWKIPKPLPWNDLGRLPAGTFQLNPASQIDPCLQIAQDFESRVLDKGKTSTQPVIACQVGRSATTDVKQVQSYTRPLPPGRHGDFVPTFHGISLQHVRWVKQLRRFESFSRTQDSGLTLAQVTHRQREWRSILRAPGFPQGFAGWWKSQTHTSPGAPHELPFDPPNRALSLLICLAFEQSVRHLEQVLSTRHLQSARERRNSHPRLIFQDIKSSKAPIVELLEDTRTATVRAVCPDESALELETDVVFHSDRPIRTSSGPLEVIHASEDKLWVGDLLNLQPGAKLVQEIHVGRLHDLFEMFRSEWAARWDRHLHVPEDRWNPLIHFIDSELPPGPAMPYSHITLPEWKQAIRKKKVHSATGPDGWSRADLLVMPDDLSEALLAVLHAVESGSPWPKSTMTGLIHSLQKSEHASQVNHYRPITLCSMIYRCWATMRAKQVLAHLLDQTPSFVCGNVPGRSTTDLWYDVQLRIEQCQLEGSEIAGCVLDIVKAFNHLPRLPIQHALAKLGICPQILRGWSSALCQLERRFVIRGAVSAPQKSTTGYPEGCPLSVTAMLATNIVASRWLEVNQPLTSIHSFVDNIELLGASAPVIQSGFEQISSFFDAMDLEIDAQKTYFWASAPGGRAVFRDDGQTTRAWARDLGAHMQYTKLATNSVITQKIQAFQPKWRALARSVASASQKKHALIAAAWPNLLHGISSVHLGSAHFDSLRTQAIRSFADPTPGTSPIAILSLCHHPKLDPEFHALWVTIQDFRNQTSRDRVQGQLDLASVPSDRSRPAPGPCQVLLHRLHFLGWTWHSEMGFLDAQLHPIDLWHVNFQELSVRVVEAWQSRQAARLMDRKTFAGISSMHARFTVERKPTCDIQRGILQTCWEGTFFTANHLRHRAEPGDTKCAFCGAEDSAFHRHWKCPAMESARAACPEDIRNTIGSHPLATSCHGWVPIPPRYFAFRSCLAALPDETWSHDFPTPIPDILDLFTDGACELPHDMFCRLASWGVTVFQPASMSFVPISSGILTGIVQTIVRAEYTAAVAALRFVQIVRKPFRMWVDNQQVFQFLQAVWQGHNPSTSPRRPNHDLKCVLRDLLMCLGHLCRGIHKVCSHQSASGLEDVAEFWACEGNDSADSVASSALTQQPALVDLWTAMCQEFVAQRTFRDAVHQVLIRVGALAISRLKGLDQASELHPNSDPVLQPLVMQPWIFPASLPQGAAPFAVSDWNVLAAWNNSLHQSGDVQYMSWYQLYADFCLRYQPGGPWYHVPTLRWWSADSAPRATWLRRCRWFSTFWIKLAKHLRLQLPVSNRRPSGHTIAFWVNCMPVMLTSDRVSAIDAWMSGFKAVYYSSKDLRWID